MKVDVCVATYRRPDWLFELLQSLDAQALPQSVQVRVIIVDNDALGSAREVVDGFQPSRVSLRYFVQPEKNIALTRNMALDHVEADMVALVDDDEVVPVRWLADLLACQKRFGADVVFGPVEGCFIAEPPTWVRKAKLFAPRRLETGAALTCGGTGNVLMHAKLIESGARFDPKFGLTGGEDTDFFYRLSRNGHRLVWCQEAMAQEKIPPARARLRWLMRRSFRGGQVFADVVGRPGPALAKLAWACWRVCLLMIAVVLVLGSLLGGRGAAVRQVIKVAATAGQLSTLFRYRLQEYR